MKQASPALLVFACLLTGTVAAQSGLDLPTKPTLAWVDETLGSAMENGVEVKRPLFGSRTVGHDDAIQTYDAFWKTGIRGAGCGTTGLPNPCCNGDLREILEYAGDGVLFDRFAINSGSWGMPARATFWTATPTTEEVGLTLIDRSGRMLAQPYTWLDSPISHNGGVEFTVPRGAVEGVFWSCLSGAMTAHYEAGPRYEVVQIRHKANAPICADVVGPTTVGGGVGAKATWTIPDTLQNGNPARVSRLEVRVQSLTVSDATIKIRNEHGFEVASGPAPLVTRAIRTPGTYTIFADPCSVASAGAYTVVGAADLVPAASPTVGGSAVPTTPRTTQAYEAEWKVGLGPACYSSLVAIPCCMGKFAETVQAVGDGITFDRFAIEAGTWATPFTMKADLAIEGFILTFLDRQGNIVLTKWGAGVTNPEARGIVPERAVEAIAWSCVSGPMTASYRAGAADQGSP